MTESLKIEQGLCPEATIRSVTIFGSADLEQTDPVCEAAYAAAKALAQRGYQIVNGGGPGVMQAATAGAESVGGNTLVITFTPKAAPHYQGSSVANLADARLETDDYIARVGLLIEKGDAFVVFKGGTGTISEWGLIWLLAHIYYGQHKPFVLFGAFWRDVIRVMQEYFLIEEVELKVFRIAETVEEMLTALDELEAEKRVLQAKDNVEEIAPQVL